MAHSLSQSMHVIAQIVLFREGKFLLTKRKVEHDDDPRWDGYWQIPTGTVNFGEDIKEAVIREAQEELGIDVTLERTLAVTQKVNHDEGWHGVFMAFLCKQVDETQPITINHEAYEYGWYTPDQITQLKVIPSTVDTIKYVLKYYRLFELGVLGIIDKGGKYLMTKVFAPLDPRVHGKWGFIAGMSEPYETLAQTLLREAREEVSLDIEIVRMIPHVKEEENFKLFCFLAKLCDPTQKVVINDEASDWGWYTREEALRLELLGDTELLLDLLERGN